jgi:hypothetical protein
MGERDAIADSDQGKSFRAFWDFLMSQSRQEELSALLESVLALPPVSALAPDPRLKRVHFDWLEAGGHAQKTVAQLSQQLRRFLDDKAWLENRRIMDILRSIEAKTVALRDTAPALQREAAFTTIDGITPDVVLPFERPLYQLPIATVLTRVKLAHANADDGSGPGEVDAAALFAQVYVDKPALAAHIRHALQLRAQVSLAELVTTRPLRQGLSELVAYLQLAAESPDSVVDEATLETVLWFVNEGDVMLQRQAQLPRIIFVRQ